MLNPKRLHVGADPFGIDDIYIALVTPAVVITIEWLVRRITGVPAPERGQVGTTVQARVP